MKFNVVVALFASASALNVGKFNYGNTAFCKYELNEKGSCAPMGTNPESCRVPENIPNNADCSAFVEEKPAAPAKPVAHAQQKKRDENDPGEERPEKEECHYKANDDKTACELKSGQDGCKPPAVVPSNVPDCNG